MRFSSVTNARLEEVKKQFYGTSIPLYKDVCSIIDELKDRRARSEVPSPKKDKK